jgi:hypothetical protein
VWVYVPSCLGSTPSAPSVSAVADYFPTGDFPYFSGTVSSPMSATGATLGLPAATRSIEIGLTTGSVAWTGLSLVPDAGAVNVLALPANTACQLTRGSGRTEATVSAPLLSDMPFAGGLDTGEALGAVDAEHALLVQAGVTSALILDLGQGAVSGTVTLSQVRNDATVTPGPSGAGQVLVAGGWNMGDTIPREDAELLALASGTGSVSTSTVVLLQEPRKMHGALVLPATSETLLLGGIGVGKALDTIESVSAASIQKQSSTPLSVHLSNPRVRPTALWLPTGQVFVGGGFDLTGTPLYSAEWLNGDLTTEPLLQTICTPDFGKNTPAPWSFAPLEGGAVLAVLAAKVPSGCASNVFVLRSDSVQSVSPISTPMDPPILLFAGAKSMPLLIVNSSVSRYDPWENGFAVILSTTLPESLPIDTFVSADPGLALWQSQDDHLNAFRFDMRNAYSTDSPGAAPGLSSEPTEWAPDRAAGTDVSFVSETGLTLSNSASAFLTDATFADVSITFTISSSLLTPVLRDNDTGALFPIDLSPCVNKGAMFLDAIVEVQRSGATVSAGLVTEQGTALNPCSVSGLGASERVALGFRGPTPGRGSATVSDVTVTRLGSTN